MIAFVTGASGFIGSRLVDALLREGWEVRALVHRSPIPGGEHCRTVSGDLTDPSSYEEEMRSADIVFHLAAALGASRINRDEFARINALGTRAVLDAARRMGVKRVVHFSSAGVLGDVTQGNAAAESRPPNPKSDYDRSKLEGERLALRCAEAGQDIVIVRPGWVYGPGDRRTFKLFRAVAGRRFVLVTRGGALQTPVYIEDLLHGIRLCAEKGRKGEIYHLAGGEILTVRRIVETIATAADTRIPPFTLPLLPTRLAAWVLEKTFRLFGREAPLTRGRLAFFIHPKPLAIEKAERELGFVPRIRFRDGVVLALAWYRRQGWL